MQVAYYALRRFCPYQGMIQVVDVGGARAYSTDGRHWTVRLQSPNARGLAGGQADASQTTADDLMKALNDRPPLPFPQQDRIELWLLDKQSHLPLALVKTRRSIDEIDAVKDPSWRPFLSTTTGFQCAALAAGTQRRASGPIAPARAQDVLERQVNLAARPLPRLQWFQRLDDGSGLGQSGMRVDEHLLGRHLPAEAFPELLVSDVWEDPTTRALVQDYHAWHASLLLAHQNLSHATRDWLEQAVHRCPAKLLDNYAMFPEVLDKDAMQVALVSAKLIQAS
ncbi:MAG: hypothetical protein WCZ87_01695 [Thiohalobacteraceae bacterium]